ncbi:hypothetical protein [Gordonia polyisoprenivorans]|uniref:hypothetical protein n=1 Tax=Gordonia polyisoprenivorans TaxID=84595 RepID=UPI001AD6B72C|nr:hypothetical protein [Gordonia polyisoprenivorans]QTI67570.1 hypothetical protein J6U32_18550 [Gordonia polyisoprenivorans]
MTLLDDIERQDRLRDKDFDTTERAPRRTRGGVGRPTRSRAAQRAIDRHSKRTASQERGARRGSVSAPVVAASGARRISLSERLSRVPFVIPVLLVLAFGLGLSLWLSTKAAQDSYQIGIARQQNQELLDRSDTLKRTFESGNSAPELSDAAGALGLVVDQNPARMVIGPDGKPRIVGDPEPATGKRMPSINPDDQPNPAATIDPKKVDDSVGLGGAPTASPSSTAPSSGTAGTATPSPGAAAPGATTPAPAGTGTQPPAPAATTPAPNVLPQAAPATSNPPSGNSPETR